MNKQHERTRIIFSDQLSLIQDSCVAIIGIGGVGSFACEALARFGIKKIIIIDFDVVDITNLNRQIIALHSTIGQSKVSVMKQRILDINPECEVITYQEKYNKDNNEMLWQHQIDFMIDACDNMDSKFDLIQQALWRKVKFISSMGAANKMNSQCISICEINNTYQDRLAKVMRLRLKKAGINGKVMVCFSNEDTSRNEYDFSETDAKLGSLSYVPSTFGLRIANYCVDTLHKMKTNT